MSTKFPPETARGILRVSIDEIGALLDGLNRRTTAKCDLLQRACGPALTQALTDELAADQRLADRLMAARNRVLENWGG